ncbi:unnamed protein product [Didymodactylos carnosus]|uniref:Fibronectin type III-like domain-containing protein n=1 Tax=Didymodactylos carnosus TaxID=1234261 RepID=A0A815HKW3_9BILA|nr:unnamed protein product [Didymodactylos carnosus]CAF1353956.1 unnamed protein product [Didymodactylos carnosus]CAF3751252.1 unnamed protein product [Didymodactylos carnosus]CAF4226401.1 unnamed protein product [Didymodactylos carnosus]
MAQYSHIILLVLNSVLRFSHSQDYPFRNVSLDWSVRVDDLISRLTPDEIIDQLAYGGGWDEGVTPSIVRLNIKPYSWATECLRGELNENSTGFLQAINLAATWNKNLLYAVGNATAYEVHGHFNAYQKQGKYGVHRGLSCFSPVINIMRHPLWGRNQETYGEDPYMSGVYASNYVRGLQGNHQRYLNTNGGCKHYDVHNGPENYPVSRFSFDAVVSEYDWRSTFLPQFKACVDAGVYSVMCSYNSINGLPACANEKLLKTILRDKMNFVGYVVSDANAIVNIVYEHNYTQTVADAALLALNNGVNLELAISLGDTAFLTLHDSYKLGKIENKTLTDRVRPLIYTRMRLGEFDPIEMNPYNQISVDIIQSDEHRNLALTAAIQSFVLLKNDQNVLPITNVDKFKQVLFLGPMSNNPIQQFGDYSPILDIFYTTTPLSGLQDLFCNVAWENACVDGNVCLNYNQNKTIDLLSKGEYDLIFLSLGTGQIIESEGSDRQTMNLPNYQQQLLDDTITYTSASRTTIILLLFSATPLQIQSAQQSKNIPCIIQLGFPAQETGLALRTALFIHDNKVSSKFGRLPYTWPVKIDDVPSITNYNMHGFTYRYYSNTTQPLYNFGHGLSYSIFSYHDLTTNLTDSTKVKAGDSVEIYFRVLNNGPYRSDEIVQVYVSIFPQNTSLITSKFQLVSFERLTDVSPNVHVLMSTIITKEQMAVYIDNKGFMIIPCSIKIYVGSHLPSQSNTNNEDLLTAQITIDDNEYFVGEYISYATNISPL